MNIKKLVIAIAIPLGVGSIAGYATSSNIKSWFTTLVQPSFAPPNWVFAPVWTTLYILMGIALYLVWSKPAVNHWHKKAITIFAIQLVLNFCWSFIFFEFHQLGLAMFEIGMLWVAIFLNILVFAKISKTAAWLLVSYIMWVSFASILNFYYWSLNTV